MPDDGPRVEQPLRPSVQPMLARLVRELPTGNYIYEPKWDGFRCIAFSELGRVDLRSRNRRPLSRYFPELVDALSSLPSPLVVDGEIVIPSNEGADFNALLQRLHPAKSRVMRLAAETPASFIAFDLLSVAGLDLTTEPFRTRRSILLELFEGHASPLFVTPATTSATRAREWLDLEGSGVDGVVAKDPSASYAPGKRAQIKVKLERTAECVVGGFRWHGSDEAVGSLLLGLYDDDDGLLRHVGLTAAFRESRRRSLLHEIWGAVTEMEGHPWEHGFPDFEGPIGRLPGVASRWGYGGVPTWVPLMPQLVCEVVYDHLQGGRFRHPPHFRRWRPDRDARTCTFDQFESSSVDLSRFLQRGSADAPAG